MFDRIKTFALNAGLAERSARSTFATAFARPTIEERIVGFLRRR